MFKLLVAEDDVDVGGALVKLLMRAGFDPRWVRRTGNAIEMLAQQAFALVILDIQLPDGTAFDILQGLRERDDRTPVLILTVHDAMIDGVRGLEAGADDYLVKPFVAPELVARVNAVIRRSAGQASSDWRVGGLRLNPMRQWVFAEGRAVRLSPREFCLLLELARQAGIVVPRVRLESKLFRSTDSINSNSLEVHVCNLRRKLGRCGGAIRTVHGVGYILEA